MQAFNTESTKEYGAARRGLDDKPTKALLQQSGMKIEEQADAEPAHAQIDQHLRVVRRHEVGNCFDFDDHLAIDKNIGAEAFIELDAFVSDRNSDLPVKGDPSLSQLMTQAAPVNRFEHTRTGDPVHL